MAQPQPQHQYYAHQQQAYAQSWEGMQCYGCPVTAFDAQSVPQITQMLYREGEAWRALLALHSGVVSAAQQISAVVSESASLDTNEASNATEHRELQYCAALTQLAAQCDALHVEAVKLRGLRKARASADLLAIQALLDAHANETLAVGSSLASNASMAITTVTADVRNAIQSTRSQLAQARALLQIVKDAPVLSGRLSIGISTPDGSRTVEHSTETVFAAVYKCHAELTEDSLAQALQDLLLEPQSPATTSSSSSADAPAPAEETVAPPPQKTVPRRTSDRSQTHHR